MKNVSFGKKLFIDLSPKIFYTRLIYFPFLFSGFMEVRMVPGKKELAFIEFAEVVQAGIALQQLNGFKLTDTEVLHLTYGNQ